MYVYLTCVLCERVSGVCVCMYISPVCQICVCVYRTCVWCEGVSSVFLCVCVWENNVLLLTNGEHTDAIPVLLCCLRRTNRLFTCPSFSSVCTQSALEAQSCVCVCVCVCVHVFLFPLRFWCSNWDPFNLIKWPDLTEFLWVCGCVWVCVCGCVWGCVCVCFVFCFS